jgi:hypothetical protein
MVVNTAVASLGSQTTVLPASFGHPSEPGHDLNTACPTPHPPPHPPTPPSLPPSLPSLTHLQDGATGHACHSCHLPAAAQASPLHAVAARSSAVIAQHIVAVGCVLGRLWGRYRCRHRRGWGQGR